jgi:hypothetical protein
MSPACAGTLPTQWVNGSSPLLLTNRILLNNNLLLGGLPDVWGPILAGVGAQSYLWVPYLHWHLWHACLWQICYGVTL